MARTNYNKMSNRPNPTPEKVEVAEVEEPVIETAEAPVEEPVVTIPEFKCGTVSNCILLNVRKKPSTSADIIGTLSAGETVVIHDEIGDFYKIGNMVGDAYCMKKYITIEK